MKPALRIAIISLVPLTLSGCVNDTASYMIDGDRNHAITLTRSQKWFWSDQVFVSVLAARQPECMGGLEIPEAPGGEAIALHQAPEEYPEPIYILDVAGNHYAISTDSCRVQKFVTAPADLGPVIGSFKTVNGKFQYVAGK
ncbi:MAG: hypothetical protein COS39_06520 [Hydrogenophilales bacterium CG03_land_8_20_14_0_80_62_28]|nr:hypothetical protein [Betaproteobacteria bacterium]OIO78614.1 MAG: hypothetical protein AUJ86_04375 [Hydrogenophilaceae bacterium CG1_02_62_390]PIV22706.1 MAG: hypothetical protein COS39_06520 [Hydrogenophilales bacterium CG03_land_8_20_14_0_80_62_28]PIW39084.1 MAG: hypothetical protein COW23_03120 [Hydrogenophilales bacterium CG15_BIG_FIL_POST_REV_8_21_14_020_62_31]PIW72786.1 MAG: hypothetical protein COW07_00920 [Hydrogenophilales bacterium CG12_big_fil_rev_8_21_14_0_65_61_21]PIX01379.1 M